MENRNTKQDIEIAKLSERIRSLEEKFDNFINNEFKHLRNKVEDIENRILWGFIVMIGATLILQVLMGFLK